MSITKRTPTFEQVMESLFHDLAFDKLQDFTDTCGEEVIELEDEEVEYNGKLYLLSGYGTAMVVSHDSGDYLTPPNTEYEYESVLEHIESPEA